MEIKNYVDKLLKMSRNVMDTPLQPVIPYLYKDESKNNMRMGPLGHVNASLVPPHTLESLKNLSNSGIPVC